MSDDPSTLVARVRVNSSQRRAQQKVEVRQALLKAASDLFLERGLVGFSLRGVAERVGYSATTVYLYFENKDDLLFAVSLDGFEQFGRALQSAYETTDDPVERIGAIGRAYIRFGVTHPAHYRLMFMEHGEFLLKKNPRDQKPTIDAFGILVCAVHEAQAAGRLRTDDPMALVYTLWAGCTASSPSPSASRSCTRVTSRRVPKGFSTCFTAASPQKRGSASAACSLVTRLTVLSKPHAPRGDPRCWFTPFADFGRRTPRSPFQRS